MTTNYFVMNPLEAVVFWIGIMCLGRWIVNGLAFLGAWKRNHWIGTIRERRLAALHFWRNPNHLMLHQMDGDFRVGAYCGTCEWFIFGTHKFRIDYKDVRMKKKETDDE